MISAPKEAHVDVANSTAGTLFPATSNFCTHEPSFSQVQLRCHAQCMYVICFGRGPKVAWTSLLISRPVGSVSYALRPRPWSVMVGAYAGASGCKARALNLQFPSSSETYRVSLPTFRHFQRQSYQALVLHPERLGVRSLSSFCMASLEIRRNQFRLPDAPFLPATWPLLRGSRRTGQARC